MTESQTKKDSVSRRSFLQHSAAGAAAASIFTQAQSSQAAANANSRLRVAFLGVGGRCQAHIRSVMKLQENERGIEAAAVCDVFNRYRDRAVEKIQKGTGKKPLVATDYRELLDRDDIDVVCVATPDHWHARMTIEAMQKGKHVYCEKPMTHTVQEAQDVVNTWKETGKMMQVGVQRTSDGRWRAANDFIKNGRIGKVVQAQTEYYRNSGMGQWRYYGLSRDMTPKNIDWKMFLGTEFGLAPEMPFDRAKFAQWRCYWPFGSGLYTDLFVHRLTQMLISLGVRYPRRVVGGGGIFLEYDGRDVPDTATIVADYDEGLQVLISATMCNNHPIEQAIRGHFGTIVFNLANDGFDFQPERPQVTRLRDIKPEHVSAFKPKDETLAHWENFLNAIAKNDQQHCNNPPDLGAAAVTTVNLGAQSYRFGKVFEWDKEQAVATESGEGYAKMWEEMSEERAVPRHVPGWKQDPLYGSRQKPNDYQKLEGPWKNGVDPAT